MAGVKYCPSCGAENPEESCFCVQCGFGFPVQTVSDEKRELGKDGLKVTEFDIAQKPEQKQKIKKIALIAAGAAVLLIIILILSNDPSKGVKDMVFGEMTMSIGGAFDLRFTDGKWSNDDDYVYYTGNDEWGRHWEFSFSLFDNDTRAVIQTVTMNGIPLIGMAFDYTMEFLDNGDIEDFNDKITALDLLGTLFGG